MKQQWLTRICLPMPVTLGAVNVYLIRGPGGAALVDTGMNDATSRAKLEETLSRMGLALGDIDQVICTHHHADHAGFAGTLADAGAKTLMSAGDRLSLRKFFDEPELDETRATFYGKHEVPEDFARRVTPVFPFFRRLSQDFEPSQLVEDNQEVLLAGIPFKVISTPGHTLGHICLLHEDEGIVLTGDCVIPNDATHVSMRPETQGTDALGGFLLSLERLRDLGPLFVAPGHGEPFEDLAARCVQLLGHHAARLDRISNFLDGRTEPMTAYQIANEALGSRPKTFATWLLMSQTIGYLEHLVAQGRAEEVVTDEKIRYVGISRRS